MYPSPRDLIFVVENARRELDAGDDPIEVIIKAFEYGVILGHVDGHECGREALLQEIYHPVQN